MTPLASRVSRLASPPFTTPLFSVSSVLSVVRRRAQERDRGALHSPPSTAALVPLAPAIKGATVVL